MTDFELKLSVVIASYNGEAYLERCLESFTNQSIDSSLFEVITVDNNSKDNTAVIAKKYSEEYPNFLYVLETNQGVSHARNRGIRESKGQYICFIDDDGYADKDWLKNVIRVFEENDPSPVVCGGQILPYYTTEKPRWFKDWLEIRSRGDKAFYLSVERCRYGFPEANLCIKKEVLDEVGGFSTDFGPKGEKMVFGEGVELSTRITEKYPVFIYDPDMIVYHLTPKRNMSLKYILSRRYRGAYNYQIFENRYLSTSKKLFTFFFCLARIPVYFLMSLFIVRWFTHNGVSDWLRHAIQLISCAGRMACIFRQFTGLEKA